ncbi:hypothetical protein PMAYCL1PPCAC_32834, partial [Pristionchus mayeri]
MRVALVLAAVAAVIAAQTDGDYYTGTGSPSWDDGNDASTSTPASENYCACTPKKIYLDIVFIVDASADMTSKTVGDATATIQSTLLGLTFGTEFYQSNVAVLAYGDKVQTVKDFGTFRNDNDIFAFSLPYLGGKATKMTDAILQASSMISVVEREFTRGVIVLMSKSFNQLDATNIREASDAFQYDGGVFITIDYSKGQGIKGLQDIATKGYYINDASSRPDSLNADMLYAFCDANCFCPDGLYPYGMANPNTGREVPMGCYHVAEVASVYNAAEQNCLGQKGFVSTIHDNDKQVFLMGLFPPKSRYWIGFKNNGNGYEWADGVQGGSISWAPGNPVAGQDCVYSQQTQGFSSSWFSAPCTDPLKNSMSYACQLRPCDTEYDCFV